MPRPPGPGHDGSLLVAGAGPLGSLIVRILGSTWRVRFVGRDREKHLISQGTSPLYAFWHGKLLTLAFTYRRQGVIVLISQNRDGEIIARIVERMGYGTIRGSSSKDGLRAVVDMVKRSRAGYPVAVTPDGPRGPFEELQPGLLLVGQRSQAPIVAMGVAAHPSTRMGSWDAFLVPHPFARCVISVAPPFRVPPDLSPAELIERVGPTVRRFIKANDDHAHAQLLRWVSGQSKLSSFNGSIPEGMDQVLTEELQGGEAEAHGARL